MHKVTFEVVSPVRPAVSSGLLAYSYFYLLVDFISSLFRRVWKTARP